MTIEKIEAELMNVITPDNVRLGHTWLRRQVKLVMDRHRNDRRWSGPDGWEHDVGSRLYVTTDGRGEVRVVPGNSPFSVLYEAWLDGKKIGQKATRTLAFKMVEKSK